MAYFFNPSNERPNFKQVIFETSKNSTLTSITNKNHQKNNTAKNGKFLSTKAVDKSVNKSLISFSKQH